MFFEIAIKTTDFKLKGIIIISQHFPFLRTNFLCHNIFIAEMYCKKLFEASV